MPSLLEREVSVAFNRVAMIEALAKVVPIIPARSPKPVLELVRLVVDPDRGTVLEATDLEVGIRHRVLGIEGGHPLTVLLHPARFGSLLRGAVDETVAITQLGDSGKVRIAGRGWKFDLPTEDPASYPDIPDFDAANFHVAASADLERMIRRTIFATDVESTRYALGGCLLTTGPETLIMVGTDGRRLGRQIAAAETEGTKPPEGQAVIPVKALKLIRGVLDKEDPPVHIAWTNSAVLIRTDAAVIWTRLVEGRYPKYEDIIPTDFETVVTVGAGDLLDACERARIATSEESRGVDFAFQGATLKLSAQAADVGEGESELEIATVGGPPLTITLDARYLCEALKAIDRKATLRIEMTNPKAAFLFRTTEAKDDYTHLMMPLSRDR